MHLVGDVGGAATSANPFEALAQRMDTLSAAMPENDGVRAFNALYRAVTKAVGAEFDERPFEDPAFFSRLAPTFANLYFDSLEAAAEMHDTSPVWEAMFKRRFASGIAPLQFAIAGMNAHINHDLSLALVSTTKELGLSLQMDTAQHRDHMRVNAILARVMQQVKGELQTGVVAVIGRSLGRIDDHVANWTIRTARNHAWTQAQRLAALDGIPFVHDEYRRRIARSVTLSSRVLLVRTSWRRTPSSRATGRR
jgi:hypothetical protein